MRLARTDRRSGSGFEGRERVARSWEREWREAATVERAELRGRHRRPIWSTWAGLGVATLITALLPAVLPLSPGYPRSATAAQVFAAALAATGAISIVPLSMLTSARRWGRRSVSGGLLLVAVGLGSAGAAAIHLAVAKDHFEEYTLFGLFFVGSGLAQLAWAVWVVVRPSRALVALGVAGNVLIAALWVVDRVWGLPIGPEHWKPESIGFADALASGFELFIAAGCLALLGRGSGRSGSRSRLGPRGALLLALPVLVLTTLGLLSVLGVASSVLTPSA
jgi:hypothetical protein